jgi:ribonuclease VapC
MSSCPRRYFGTAAPRPSVSEVVLDASAVLALLRSEPGADKVAVCLPAAIISSVNLAEVIAKGVERGTPLETVTAALAELPIAVEPFTEEDAYRSGALRPVTRAAGLSLGDRCALALGLRTGLPVLTTERGWAKLDVGAKVELIR